MRLALILVVALAGCSAVPETGETGTAPEQPADSGTEASAAAILANASLPNNHWINGTFQNAGQCLIYPQSELDRLDWHELPNWTRGLDYTTETSATVGPAPTILPGSGVCLYFDQGGTNAAGGTSGTIGNQSGTVPDQASRVAVMTDGAVGGKFSIHVTR